MRERVTVRSIGSTRPEVNVSGHRLTVDMQPDLGGGGEAPSPFELLLASLGSCTAMAVRTYADRKGWPLRGVRVELEHERARGRSRISKRLVLVGDLSEEQCARLRYVAGRCPVSQALTYGVEMEESCCVERGQALPTG